MKQYGRVSRWYVTFRTQVNFVIKGLEKTPLLFAKKNDTVLSSYVLCVLSWILAPWELKTTTMQPIKGRVPKRGNIHDWKIFIKKYILQPK